MNKGRKTAKRLVSLLLAILLAFSMTTLLAGAKSEKARYPHIYIHGFMAETLYENPGTDEQKKIWPPSTDVITSAVKEMIPTLATAAITGNSKALADSLVPAAKKILEPAFLDKNGEAPANTGVDFVYPTKEEIQSSDELDFCYDWRLSPIESAKKLDAFIDYVCAEANTDKVTITAHSYGGVVTLSYITLFGTEKLHGVIFDSTAVYGETFTGELLTGKIGLSVEGIKSFLEFILDRSDYENLIETTVTMLTKAGVMDFVVNKLNALLEQIKPQAVTDVMFPMFCCWPTIWAMCPDEYFDDAYEYAFNEVLNGKTEEYSGLIKKINEFNILVRNGKTEKLIETESKIRFGVYSGYGYSAIPVTPTWNSNGDGTVDTKYTSFGATVAPYCEVLSEKYLKGRDMSLVSPDKQVDASTCLFPKQTWFVKNYKHAQSHSGLNELSAEIFYSDEKITTDSLEKYPQFLEFSAETKQIETATNEEPLNPLTKFFKGLIEFWKLIKSFFSKLF